MAGATRIQRPQRWDNPFSPDMGNAVVDRILDAQPFVNMDAAKFPESASLHDIIQNDTCLNTYQRGDIVVRVGDYGTSAFLVISGQVRVVLPPGLPASVLGQEEDEEKSFWGAFSQLWDNSKLPESRDISRYEKGAASSSTKDTGTNIFLQGVPQVLDEDRTVLLGPGEMFGEIAALARSPRMTTIYADGDAEVLEIRRQGIRDIRRRIDEFREHIDKLYRERSLKTHIQQTPVFRHLSDDIIDKIAEKTLFETFGDFDWHTSYKRFVTQPSAERLAKEPIIAREGDYPDGLMMLRSGFARVSSEVNHGHQTLRYIGRGAIHGFEEIVHNWRNDEPVGLQNTIRSVGYTDILRVPTSIIEEFVLPTIPEDRLPKSFGPSDGGASQPIVSGVHPDSVGSYSIETSINTGLLEFLVDNRYINGTATMLIDLDRCVRCDSCVEACTVGHNNNPRFNRHGRRLGNFMVANACMHCADPVCMLGCPTGAIHRSALGGQVVINDDSCIGCTTCANNCPYDNIRMVEIRDDKGDFILDEAAGTTVMKATKCDLCLDQPGGPACQRACPHDALIRMNMRHRGTLSRWLNR
ncbi:MAG: cyclic nucleotide-binding domain-containing protein [Rhodospirillaceae bacterium]|nr:cyclic nucleotide-binding domain-containing protein [Rhodospirillaceae bacterium]